MDTQQIVYEAARNPASKINRIPFFWIPKRSQIMEI